MNPVLAETARVPNRGAACTAASVLSGLRLLGAPAVPSLEEATLALGAPSALAAPAVLDYLALPGRRAPLDLRIERLAATCGIAVRSRTSPVTPWRPPKPRPGSVLIVHLAWGQEAPGRRGAWGWLPLRPSTYSTGGHSVLLIAAGSDGWTVLDPNLPGLQHWPRAGVALTATVLAPAA